MKRLSLTFFISGSLLSPVFGQPQQIPPTSALDAQMQPQEQYTATVQLFIKEPTPQLVRRSQRLAVRELTRTFKSRRELELNRFDMQVSPSGNSVLLTVASNKDIQIPVQHALSSVISGLDGKVWARGRGDIFKTSFSDRVGMLDIQLADPPLPEAQPGQTLDVGDVLIQRIIAVSIPVRDLLTTLKAHIVQDSRLPVTAFGHSMDHTCASRRIDWMVNESNEGEPRTVNSLIEELAAVLNANGVVKKDTRYVFSGVCPNSPSTHPSQTTVPIPLPSLAPRPVTGGNGQNGFHMANHTQAVNVEIPLMPLGRW